MRCEKEESIGKGLGPFTRQMLFFFSSRRPPPGERVDRSNHKYTHVGTRTHKDNAHTNNTSFHHFVVITYVSYARTSFIAHTEPIKYGPRARSTPTPSPCLKPSSNNPRNRAYNNSTSTIIRRQTYNNIIVAQHFKTDFTFLV